MPHSEKTVRWVSKQHMLSTIAIGCLIFKQTGTKRRKSVTVMLLPLCLSCHGQKIPFCGIYILK